MQSLLVLPCPGPEVHLQGAQYDGFSGQFFHIFEIKLFYFVLGMSDLVHDVETIHGLC